MNLKKSTMLFLLMGLGTTGITWAGSNYTSSIKKDTQVFLKVNMDNVDCFESNELCDLLETPRAKKIIDEQGFGQDVLLPLTRMNAGDTITVNTMKRHDVIGEEKTMTSVSGLETLENAQVNIDDIIMSAPDFYADVVVKTEDVKLDGLAWQDMKISISNNVSHITPVNELSNSFKKSLNKDGFSLVEPLDNGALNVRIYDEKIIPGTLGVIGTQIVLTYDVIDNMTGSAVLGEKQVTVDCSVCWSRPSDKSIIEGVLKQIKERMMRRD